MAVEGGLKTWPGLVCGATTLAAQQYKAVKLHTDGTVIIASAQGERVIGILQNAPAVGQAAEVAYAGISKVSCDAALTGGAPVTTQSDGQVMDAAAADYVLGFAMVASGGADEIGSVLLSLQGVL